MIADDPFSYLMRASILKQVRSVPGSSTTGYQCENQLPRSGEVINVGRCGPYVGQSDIGSATGATGVMDALSLVIS